MNNWTNTTNNNNDNISTDNIDNDNMYRPGAGAGRLRWTISYKTMYYKDFLYIYHTISYKTPIV